MLSEGKAKDFKTMEAQLQILKNRGLIVSEDETALQILRTTNYYRLSAYSLTLRKNDFFYEGITLDNVYELYCFDDAFRKIIMGYTANIEIAFRALISYHHSEKYGPIGYMSNSNFEDKLRHAMFLRELDNEVSRSDDVFINHHHRDLEDVYPFWVAIEVTTFGVLSKLFKNLDKAQRTYISKTYYDVHRKYIENWLQSAVFARNIAAHGGRFYNRTILSCPVKLDRQLRATISNKTPFSFIFAVYRLLPTNELRTKLKKDLIDLFEMHPFAEEKRMGFPENWIKLLEEQTQ